jgi:hypothetical protein
MDIGRTAEKAVHREAARSNLYDNDGGWGRLAARNRNAAARPRAIPLESLSSRTPGMIVEGLVTTVDPAGRMHLAAMGPTVDDAERAAGRLRRIRLRPFATSQTAAHLLRTRCGVFHLTDDVLLLAQTVIGQPAVPPARPAEAVAGFVLDEASLALEFEVTAIDESAERLSLEARVVATHVGRPFLGFNRAAHAVVEAAILVTRLHLLDAAEIRRRFADLEPLVEKTGGPREREAFGLLAGRLAEAS